MEKRAFRHTEEQERKPLPVSKSDNAGHILRICLHGLGDGERALSGFVHHKSILDGALEGSGVDRLR